MELEWQSNAQALTSALHARGLSGCSELHGYHCDCPDCLFEDGSTVLKAQTDSSCDGEIITDVLRWGTHASGYHPLEIMREIQDAAVDVDAEPGWTSGVHVHVGVDHIPVSEMAKALWAFIKWEPTLNVIARGRFTDRREENLPVRDRLAWMLTDYCEGQRVVDLVPAVDDGYVPPSCENVEHFYRHVYNHSREYDRHTNLATSTHHGTWEFRLWNSTRAAWRMEMYVRVSQALTNPTVVAELLDSGPVRRAAPSRLMNILSDAGASRAAELIERQIHYDPCAAPPVFVNF